MFGKSSFYSKGYMIKIPESNMFEKGILSCVFTNSLFKPTFYGTTIYYISYTIWDTNKKNICRFKI